MNINKSLKLLKNEFESSCSRTPEYLEFHRVFKRELKTLLKPYCEEIKISKPNHFDVTGFFKLLNGDIYYFSLGDLRHNKDSILIRTAKAFDDYTGGSNGFIKMNEDFTKNLFNFCKIEVKQ